MRLSSGEARLLTNTSVQELIKRHLEVNRSRHTWSKAESDDGVPAGPVEESADEEVRDFGDDLAEAEGLPGVDLGLLLAS